MSAPAKKIVFKKAPSAPAKSKMVEEDGSSTEPKTAQEIYDQIQVLLAQLVKASGGKPKKGFKKDGTPRAKRTNTSGWNAFVTEYREANPEVSWKDAMVACKADWAALKGEAVPEEESSVKAAPAPAPKPAAAAQKPAAKKLVIAKTAAAAAPPLKTAAELMAQAMAEAEAEVPKAQVEEFDWEGQILQKNAKGFCWRVDEDGEQIFVGRWDAVKEEMDETAEEPSYGSA